MAELRCLTVALADPLALQPDGPSLPYTRLDASGNAASLAAQLRAEILRLKPASQPTTSSA